MSDESPVAYKHISLPTALCDEMDKIINEREDLGFKSRAEMTKQAIREYMEKIVDDNFIYTHGGKK